MDRFVAANAVLSLFGKNYTELKKDLPIRPSEMGVLNILTETSGPHTPLLLARMLGVSKPMITAHITALQGKGYITKQPCETDLRAYYILPTEKAIELTKRTKAEMNAKLESLAQEMGREDFDRLVALAARANEIMKSNQGESTVWI